MTVLIVLMLQSLQQPDPSEVCKGSCLWNSLEQSGSHIDGLQPVLPVTHGVMALKQAIYVMLHKIRMPNLPI